MLPGPAFPRRAASVVLATALAGVAPPGVARESSSCQDDDLIRSTPDAFGAHLADGFTRHVELMAPNGKPIHIFAQGDLSEEQILRAVNVLRFFLADAPGTRFGGSKQRVVDSMADHGAVLLLPNGADRDGPEPRVAGQPLYWNEIAVEGSAWYQENDYGHRDATFEEVFHLVHDLGVGTFVDGALPEYQAELQAAAMRALEDGTWGRPVMERVSDWLEELAAEGSLAQEYIAAAIDSYYGLWAEWNERDGGMWGIYAAKTRKEMAELDPEGLALVEAFLPPWLGYEARLARVFDGQFSLTFDPEDPYTHKSRYLVNATLTGDNHSSLLGNARDNALRGNAGDNRLDGGPGTDTVIYCRDRSSYTVEPKPQGLLVIGEGRDLLIDIEFVRFADGQWSIEELRSGL